MDLYLCDSAFSMKLYQQSQSSVSHDEYAMFKFIQYPRPFFAPSRVISFALVCLHKHRRPSTPRQDRYRRQERARWLLPGNLTALFPKPPLAVHSTSQTKRLVSKFLFSLNPFRFADFVPIQHFKTSVNIFDL